MTLGAGRDVVAGEAARQVDALLRRERAEQRRGGEQVLEQPLAREAVERLGELRQLAGGGAQRVGAHLEQIGLADDLHRAPSAAARRPAPARRRWRLRRGAPARSACRARRWRRRARGRQRRGRSWCPARPRARRRRRAAGAPRAPSTARARTRPAAAPRAAAPAGTSPGSRSGSSSTRRPRPPAARPRSGRARRRASAAAPRSSDRAAPGGRRGPRRGEPCAVELRQRLVQRHDVGAERVQRLRSDERVQRPPTLQVVEGDGRVDAPRQIVLARRHAQVGDLHARVEVRRQRRATIAS